MSSAIRRIARPSLKQHIRIWFEFYKIALADDRFAAHVQESRSYYEPWGEVRGRSFDHWWKDHSTLFDDLRVREVQRVTANPDTIYVSVPLGMDTKRSVEQFRDLLAARQKAEAEVRGRASKRSNRVAAGRFHLTPGVDFRGRTADVILRLYRDVYLPAGRPPIGADFARLAASFFDSPRFKMRLHFLPTSSSDPTYSQDQLRALRRYIKRAESLIMAAAKGDFPGRSTLGSLR